MMAKSADTRQGNGAADASADLARAAADMPKNLPLLQIHPLMAHPAAAMAAATAIGFSFSTQMASAFFGALQGAVDATNMLAAALEEQGDPATTPAPSVKVETAERAKAEPDARPEPEKVAGAFAPAAAEVAGKVDDKAATAKPKTAARSRRPAAKTDDLKRISGIGPKLETVLNGRGIRSFADIAAWTEADVKRIDAELGFEGRIARDDWVGQARLLAPKAPGRK